VKSKLEDYPTEYAGIKRLNRLNSNSSKLLLKNENILSQRSSILMIEAANKKIFKD
jgi:hypothetical protein